MHLKNANATAYAKFDTSQLVYPAYEHRKAKLVAKYFTWSKQLGRGRLHI